MSGFYSIQPRAWPGKAQQRNVAHPDPYSPGSPDHASRNLVTATAIAGGMIREDIGQPIARNADEPQPVTVRAPKALPIEPTGAPEAPPKLPAATAQPRDWRNDYGLGKGL